MFHNLKHYSFLSIIAFTTKEKIFSTQFIVFKVTIIRTKPVHFLSFLSVSSEILLHTWPNSRTCYNPAKSIHSTGDRIPCIQHKAYRIGIIIRANASESYRIHFTMALLNHSLACWACVYALSLSNSTFRIEWCVIFYLFNISVW